MTDPNLYTDANRNRWDETVDIHLKSDFYRIDTLLNGGHVLDELILGELGDISGLSLLHLQCHIGFDTLSLARLGANVTGVDFSPKAIEAAKSLADKINVPAHFVESQLYDAPAKINEKFDRVFTSWGVLHWLPDMTRWAQTVAHFLKPGGKLYLAEGHPVLWMMEEDPNEPGRLEIAYPYFQNQDPLRFEEPGDYADPDATLKNSTAYEWNHGLGTVVTALIKAGLKLDFLHEHDRLIWRGLPMLEPVDDRFFKMPENRPAIPLAFSLSATKEGATKEG